MRLLELEDEVADLKRQLEDKTEQLTSKADEITCLSASLLEKEKLLRGGGMGGGGGVVEDEAHLLASQSMLNRELESVKAMWCKHCSCHPFEQVNTVSELFLLHEQACFPAAENRMQVKSLRDRVASLNSEVEALKSYVEAISMEVMGDNAEEYERNTRSDRVALELSRVQARLGDREIELSKLHQILRSTDPRLSDVTVRKMALLQESVAIREAELARCHEQLHTKDAVLADLEDQLGRKTDASAIRELNHQLRQMVLVHRQLLRKFAVIDVEATAQVQQLQARDSQISQLNKDVLRLNEQLREQSEWSALQLSQLHMESMRRQAASAAGAAAAGGAGAGVGAVRGTVNRTHALPNAMRHVAAASFHTLPLKDFQ